MAKSVGGFCTNQRTSAKSYYGRDTRVIHTFHVNIITYTPVNV